MTSYKLLIEKDVDVPMRDGARLKADVFRPDDGGRFPAILNLGPYQKDKLWVPPPTLEEAANPWMNWETVNPEWWVPRGYAAVRVDGRGSGKSPGQCEPWSLAESIDFHDAIEWAAAQPWCNGNVGLSGISYFAINQWFVANHQPPSPPHSKPRNAGNRNTTSPLSDAIFRILSAWAKYSSRGVVKGFSAKAVIP